VIAHLMHVGRARWVDVERVVERGNVVTQRCNRCGRSRVRVVTFASTTAGSVF
jgi:hypothetical protein